MPDDAPVPIAAVSWILELPRDLGLPDDTTGSVVESAEVSGWRDEWDTTLFPAWSEDRPGFVPRFRIVFRRSQVGIGMPTEATDRAFGHTRPLNRLRRLLYRLDLWRVTRRGIKEWKTVCQLTRWYVGEEIPDPPRDPADPAPGTPLHDDFYSALGDLDVWLQAYGLIAGKFDVGSLSLYDLPAWLPWQFEIRQAPWLPSVWHRGGLRLHGRYPNLLPSEGDREASREATVVMGRGTDAYPFFTAYTLLFQAQAQADAARGREALVGVGTAVEALVSEVLTGALTTRGRTGQEIDELFRRSSWRDLYNRELPQVLGLSPGVSEPVHAKWWREHYNLRVRAVHHGYRPSRAEALKAVSDTWDLIEWIGVRIRSQSDIAEMGTAIRVQRRP